MDIETLKQKAEEGKHIESLKNRLIDKFGEFKEICNELSPMIAKRLATKKENFILEFVTFFKENGFSVTHENEHYKAVLDSVIVNLKDEASEPEEGEVVFSIEIKSEEVYKTVVIKATDKQSDMLYVKRPLKINDRFIEFENAEETFSSLNDLNELKRLYKNLEDNINWYKETIETFQSIVFVYGLYRNSGEFDSFKELFEAI